MNAQSNPVLFILLGRAALLAPGLAVAVAEFTDGAGYINILSKPDEAWMQAQIGRVQKEFFKRIYTRAGFIRVNYVLAADDDAYLWLPTVREWADRYASLLYPAGVLTDLYLLLNDADAFIAHTANRRNVLRLLNEQQETGARVYLLSNIDSQSLYGTEDPILHTIALLTLFKDGRMPAFSEDPDASRYHEYFFTDNCYKNNGCFLTAGSCALRIPRQAVKALLMIMLLSWGREADPDNDDAPDPVAGLIPSGNEPVSVDTHYLYGLAVPVVKRGDCAGYTRRRIINRYFGNRLDDVITRLKTDAQPVSKHGGQWFYDRLNISFYHLLRFTDEQGAWPAALRRSLSESERALATTEADLARWLDEKPDERRPLKRRLSPWLWEDIRPFMLAEAYINQSCTIKMHAAACEALRDALTQIAAFHCQSKVYEQRIDDAISLYTPGIILLNHIFSLFADDAAAYFRQQFNRFAEKNGMSLQAITAGLYAALSENKFDAYLAKLEQYVDSDILPSPAFDVPFMEQLAGIAAQTHDNKRRSGVSECITDWIEKNRHWQVRLKTGFANLYGETNLLLPEQGAGTVKRSYDVNGRGRLNLLTDEKNGYLDVLYHTGAFNADDLYYNDLYI